MSILACVRFRSRRESERAYEGPDERRDSQIATAPYSAGLLIRRRKLGFEGRPASSMSRPPVSADTETARTACHLCAGVARLARAEISSFHGSL